MLQWTSTNAQSARLRILITGMSSGLGRALAEAAVAAGHDVIGTVRRIEDKEALEAALGRRTRGHPRRHRFRCVCSGRRRDSKRPRPNDVLVNNAGYGHEGVVEESSLDELRRQFDVNVFGAVAMIKAVLPSMRERRSGHIINVTSMGGYVSFPGVAYYCGSKFALEGISGSLALEVRDLGISSFFEPIRYARIERHGNQIGDPQRAAQVFSAS